MKTDDNSPQNNNKEAALNELRKNKDKIKKEAEALSLNYQNRKTKPWPEAKDRGWGVN